MTILQENKFYLKDLGKRLSLIAETVSEKLCGEDEDTKLVAADVGTDHAKLPVFLIKTGICVRVIASDINKGPCEIARRNVEGEKLSEYIDVIHTDGLSGFERYNLNRVVIAGMGGELIAKILDNAGLCDKEKIKFVLQPQSHSDVLRQYLFENGYCIVQEKYVCEKGKDYCIISATFDGIKRRGSLIEIYFGDILRCKDDPVFSRMFEKKYKNLEKIIPVRKKSAEYEQNEVFLREEKLFCEMKKYLKRADQNDENM